MARENERDSLFGSLRQVVSSLASVVHATTGSVATLATKGTEYLDVTMNSLVDDAQHTRVIKTVENAEAVKEMNIDLQDVQAYLDIRDLVLTEINSPAEQRTRPATPAPTTARRRNAQA